MSGIYIYVLKCKGGKYYIGRSKNILKRLIEHYNGAGSSYTSKYKAISVERIIENASIYDEDRYVKEYMYMFGIDNVRGGTYVHDDLSNIQKQFIITEIFAANDLCTRCGSADHYAKSCTVSRHKTKTLSRDSQNSLENNNSTRAIKKTLDDKKSVSEVVTNPRPIKDTYVKQMKTPYLLRGDEPYIKSLTISDVKPWNIEKDTTSKDTITLVVPKR